MVNQQQVQAINQTNGINLQQMQQSSQLFSEPGLSDKIGGQQGYEPSEQGAPVDQVVKQTVQSQQQIEKKQEIQQKRQQIQEKQMREQQAKRQQAQQQLQQRQQLEQLRQQEQQLKEQIQRSQQQAQQQSPESSTDYSKYFIQTCFVIAVVAGLILYFLNSKGMLGKSKPPVPVRAPRPPQVPTATGGNINQMFKYLFNL